MRKLLTICFLAIASQLFSQNNRIDSLQRKLTQTFGSERTYVLNDLAVAYWTVDLSKSLVLAQEALVIENQLKFYKPKARTLNIIGVTNFYLKNYSPANNYYDQCLDVAKIHGSNDDIYKCLNNKIILFSNGFIKDSVNAQNIFKRYINMTIEKNNHLDFLQALMSFTLVYHAPQTKDSILFEYTEQLLKICKTNEFLSAIFGCEGYIYKINYNYFRAIDKYEESLKYGQDEMLKVFSLENIGNIYYEMGRHKESIKYFNDAISLLKSMNDYTSKNTIYFIEASLGASYIQVGDFKRALLILQDALNYNSYLDRDKCAVYNNIGNTYILLDSLDKAEYYIYKVIFLSDSLKNNEMKLGSLHSLATLLIRKNQLLKNPDLINEISNLVEKVDDNYISNDSYSLLSDYYEATGNYKRAIGYLKKWITINDSIINKRNRDELNEFQTKYETEKKDQQIRLHEIKIKSKNLILQYSLAGGGIAFMALVLIIILYRKKNQAYKQLVYQNLSVSGSNQHNIGDIDLIDDNDKGVLDTEKYDNTTLDEEHKKLISECLMKLIENKVYLESGLTIKRLAEKCGTNRTYLSIVINERYHANFNSFINKLRIEEAKRILSASNNGIIPLKELYQMLGFSSYSTFNEAFKKCIGVTPAFFQNTAKEFHDTPK